MGTKKNNRDAIILSKKKEIEQLRSKLGASSKFQPITNAVLRLNGQTYNLNVIGLNDVKYLISHLKGLDDTATKLFDEPLTLEGYKIDQWLADLWSRYHFLNRKKEEDRLKGLEKALESILSEDKKADLKLAEILGQI